MKQIFTLFTLLFCCEFIFAQIATISPDRDLEYCPSTDITFTVVVPGYQPNIFSSTNNPVVVFVNYPQVQEASSTTFSFIGKFQDNNIAQTFGVTYKRKGQPDATEYFTFRKIKSLSAPNPQCGLIQPNLTSIIAPACQVTSIPISFNKIKWFTQFESPTLCFGSVDDYEYQIPVGWKIGTTTCVNSSQWIAGNNNVSIITDANSGDGGYVNIRPINSGCGINLLPGYNQTVSIPIVRNPTFSITPASISIPCGVSETKTITVNSSIALACPVSYTWSISSPYYGWTDINGNSLPLSFTTPTNSFTFKSLQYSPLPDITVTPVFNGVSQTPLTCTASRTAIDPSPFTVLGDNSICSVSGLYSVSNLPAGSSVHWYTSTYPYGASVAQINSPTSPQTTVTAIGSGVISLIATITNQCGQQISVTKSNISVGGGVNTINGYFTNYLGQYENLKTNYEGVNYIKPNYWTNVVISNPELSSATWSWVTGSYNSWTQYQFPPNGGTILQLSLPISNDIVLYRLTNNSSCGTQAIDFLFWAKDAPYGSYYLLSPNPADDLVRIEAFDSTGNDQYTKSPQSGSIASKKLSSSTIKPTIKAIEILDISGIIHYRKDYSNLNSKVVVIPVDKLKNGIYIVKIFNGKQWKSEKLVIHH